MLRSRFGGHAALGLGSILFILQGTQGNSPSYKEMDPLLQEEYCKNFTYGNPDPKKLEFYSPGYPRNYPAGIKCFRTLEASYNYFVRVDFRDFFKIEPPSNENRCEYDYLEIRDGDQGYSPLIGKYCGDNFPPVITSSGTSLWLRFVSDGTIEYNGFRAVYEYIQNPLESLPYIPKCEFEVGGNQDFIGTPNISEAQMNFASKHGVPLECTWIIRSQQSKLIYIQFSEYELEEPNDCNFNFIEVFDGKTDEEHRRKTFCGSVAEPVTSKTDVLYIRFFADGKGLKSVFTGVFTAIRDLSIDEQDTCPEEEYDCDDATCISDDLVCNNVRNCKFGWDEESCIVEGSAIPLDFSASHVILILTLLILIMVGMCSGMIYNLVRKLTEDKEDIIASREKSLASLGIIGGSFPEIPDRTKSASSRNTSHLDCNGCYVPPPPDGGFPFATKF